MKRSVTWDVSVGQTQGNAEPEPDADAVRVDEVSPRISPPSDGKGGARSSNEYGSATIKPFDGEGSDSTALVPTPTHLLRGLLPRVRFSLWRALAKATCRQGPEALFERYESWSGGIATDVRIHRPANDAAIAALIHCARTSNQTLRIVGSASSASPCVLCEAEAGRALLAQLSAYAEPSFPNLRVERAEAQVWVNAGWSVKKLYERVHDQYPRLFLTSRPSSPYSTVGSLVVSPVHGVAENYGLLSDAVLALRVIGADGVARLVESEAELRFWRCSFGLLGVVTHVRLQFARLRDFQANHREVTLPAPFPASGVAELRLLHASVMINASLEPWQEYYLNPYSGRLLRLAWSMRAVKGKPGAQPGAGVADGGALATGVPKTVVSDTLSRVRDAPPWAEAARWSASGCSEAIDGVLDGLKAELQADDLADHDLFVLERPRRAVELRYFIPVDLGMTHVQRALAVVTGVAAELRANESPYKFDLPVEFCFVRGTDRAMLSPIYTPGASLGSTGQLFLSIALPTLTGGSIAPSFDVRKDCDNAHMRAAADAFAKVELGWREISPLARPQARSLFGFEHQETDAPLPFGPDALSDALLPSCRTQFRERMIALDPDGIFRRDFADWLHIVADADEDVNRASRSSDPAAPTEAAD
jgi:hypothetical protein